MSVDNIADRVRSWPWVSLNIRPEHLVAWTELARVAGRSRADLMREALEQVGLPYARSVARRKDAASAGSGSEKASLAPRSARAYSPQQEVSISQNT